MTASLAHILLVEDTPSLSHIYESYLRDSGYRVTCAANAQMALQAISDNEPDLILLDLRLPDMGGLDVMDRIRARNANTPVIIITGHGSMRTAIEAMRRGARNFLIKPFNVEKLQQAVHTELEKCGNFFSMPHDLAGLTDGDNDNVMDDAPPPPHFAGRVGSGFIGTSPAMLKLYERIENAARSQATVFIVGETGTGKELCAEAVHKLSSRADKPFIPINCAAIPRDLLESELFGHIKGAFTGAIADRDGAASMADGGTLFLDEVAEMALDMQTKLLRFLQNRTFMKVGSSRVEQTDVRIVCATNRDPVGEIRAGKFREDLFYRLHVLPLQMPPLRDRGHDIIDIAQTLLRRYAEEEHKLFTGMSEDAEKIFLGYNWPGNIRELQNIIRHIVVMHDGDLLTAQMLPSVMRESYDAGILSSAAPYERGGVRTLEETERDVIEDAIRRYRGNIQEAAAKLGISPSTIYRKKSLWDKDGTL